MRTALTSISVIRAYRVRARARRDISFRVTRCVSRHGCQRKRRVKGRRLSPHSACVCVFSVPVCAAHRIPDAWCVPHSGVRGRRRYATVNADDTRGFHPRVARDIGQQDRGWENVRGLGGRIFGATRSCASVSVRHLYIQQSRRNCVCVCVLFVRIQGGPASMSFQTRHLWQISSLSDKIQTEGTPFSAIFRFIYALIFRYYTFRYYTFRFYRSWWENNDEIRNYRYLDILDLSK